MKEVIEFINACPWYIKFQIFVEDYANKKGVEVISCKVGEDLGDLKKYGPLMKSTLVVRGKKYQSLSKDLIKELIDEVSKNV